MHACFRIPLVCLGIRLRGQEGRWLDVSLKRSRGQAEPGGALAQSSNHRPAFCPMSPEGFEPHYLGSNPSSGTYKPQRDKQTASFLWSPKWGLQKHFFPLTELLWRLNELIHTKHLERCLEWIHGKGSIISRCVYDIIHVSWVTVTILLMWGWSHHGLVSVPNHGAIASISHPNPNLNPARSRFQHNWSKQDGREKSG